jgi:hypothetical protein
MTSRSTSARISPRAIPRSIRPKMTLRRLDRSPPRTAAAASSGSRDIASHQTGEEAVRRSGSVRSNELQEDEHERVSGRHVLGDVHGDGHVQMRQRVDDERDLRRPSPVDGGLPHLRARGDRLDRQPAEPVLGQELDRRLEDRPVDLRITRTARRARRNRGGRSRPGHSARSMTGASSPSRLVNDVGDIVISRGAVDSVALVRLMGDHPEKEER